MIKDIRTLLGMLYGISPGRVVFTALIGSATAILSVLQIKSMEYMLHSLSMIFANTVSLDAVFFFCAVSGTGHDFAQGY